MMGMLSLAAAVAACAAAFSTAIPDVVLNTGQRMPLVGLGTSSLGLSCRWCDKQVGRAVRAALRSGCRHIDTAALYKNEQQIGKAIRAAVRAGTVRSRAELFIATKLEGSMHGRVHEAFNASLRQLGLGYVDLYLVHMPPELTHERMAPPPMSTTWAQMEAVHATGRARAIGVANFSPNRLERLLASARVVPAVNQVELHPLWRNDALVAYARRKGIQLTAYAPLGAASAAAHAEAPFKSAGGSLRHHPTVVRIAERLGRTPSQVLLRWGLQRNTSVIFGSLSPEHIRENLALAGWVLGEDDMRALSTLPDKQRRLYDFAWVLGRRPKAPPPTAAELRRLWDE